MLIIELFFIEKGELKILPSILPFKLFLLSNSKLAEFITKSNLFSFL
jgi:hypothetical protein